MSASIKITYNLKPPSGTPENNLSTSKSHEFVIPESAQGSDKAAYYAALQATIAKAREEVGGELTAWRDAVGKAELTKEAKGGVKPEGEEEEEEDESDT